MSSLDRHGELLLIGGAPRTGKSILANRLLESHDGAPFHIDLLMGQFRLFSPDHFKDCRFDTTEPIEDRMSRFLPHLLRLVTDWIGTGEYRERRIVVEGELLSPLHVADVSTIAAQHHWVTRAAFLVATNPDYELIRRHQGAGNGGWVQVLGPHDQQMLVEHLAERGQLCVAQAATSGQPVFDISMGFEDAIENAKQQLVGV